jgi:hypothetical protein
MKFSRKPEYIEAEQFLNTEESVRKIDMLLDGTNYVLDRWNKDRMCGRIESIHGANVSIPFKNKDCVVLTESKNIEIWNKSYLYQNYERTE